MTAYPELLVNASNNSLTSPILIFSVTLNFISQILGMFRLNHNHKHNSFKTTDFRLHFSILLLPKHCTPHSIKRNPYSYINPIINRFTDINLWLFAKSSMYLNPSMHMRTITSPITINRPLLRPPIQHLSLPRFNQRKYSQYNRLLFRSPIQYQIVSLLRFEIIASVFPSP